MAAYIPEPEDTELNMTPMIDIVFQLIIFFMLTLKFKEIDRQINSNLPKDRGQEPRPDKPLEFNKITIKLFRKNVSQPESEQFTRIRIDNSHTLELPKGWKGRTKDTPAQIQRYDAVVDAILSIVRGKFQAMPGNKDEVKGEIKAPPSEGGTILVPHGDVVSMLDVLLRAGITDVVFEGSTEPEHLMQVQ